MMNKMGWLVVPLSLALAGASFGATGSQEAKPRKAWLKTWFEHLKQGLTESAVQGNYQKARVTAVAAVRGNPQDAADQDKPSFKVGAKTKKAAQLKRERLEFAKAVDLVLDGKTQEGVAALDAFEKAHPKSRLLVEVREASQHAREMASADAAPETGAAGAPSEKDDKKTETPAKP